MHNSIASGKRVARRVLAAQLVAALVAALGGLLLADRWVAVAALVGALIVAGGNAVFAWRLFVPGVAPVRTILHSVYAAEVLKWVWTVAWLVLAIALWRLPALALILGMIAAQLAFFLALAKT
ncbi:MAG: ATP synthase subunit I [Lysobacterales bacterium]